uniref:Uncharacterized protein n=1 Tax=Trieres chinensis TaxID=1514140 RepID=A0A7S1ZCC5_TRICV|mmetsp:Transcript_22213/g.44956  ORF Transcript_22213/g.44956 Transcript_22213/m.44956 type:complete len:263 (+) Transcript_22213:226-1014(+)|eukprot:CAMPEP_0183315362 /NCGR_PEP_ID=MMETSP0160_2-20130417/51509_1 /TAXON_ID=2839 ORGANISM="Odontella Sinensis, Strain Grunow 1884" /NCGR_SAMPLE_ID=MMETSP0160_2 /ASSEMBLY_ACC=CAM_ASM_000250 /LENGTH=262 /DNA_ID=CAMNT_0025480899 /DNA_START=182 /DNA_END=970 /DNA_ORIENTATION=-
MNHEMVATSQAPRSPACKCSQAIPIYDERKCGLLHGEAGQDGFVSTLPSFCEECLGEPPTNIFEQSTTNEQQKMKDTLNEPTTSITIGSPSAFEHSLDVSFKPLNITPFADLASSPLTASSIEVMEKFYDKDTWRMFHRIQATRASRKGKTSQSLPQTKLYRISPGGEVQHKNIFGHDPLDDDWPTRVQRHKNAKIDYYLPGGNQGVHGTHVKQECPPFPYLPSNSVTSCGTFSEDNQTSVNSVIENEQEGDDGIGIFELDF